VSGQSTEVTEFSKFYVENVPRLVAFLVCEGVSVSDAADCVQETLIDALPPVWATLEYPYAWCRRVAQFLRRLARLGSDRQRQILAWTYDGATPAEIAAELGMHPATVRSTLRNARAALRRLRAEGGEQK
jgi:RNA polymerase sigma-70 factor (ECF subfamily)